MLNPLIDIIVERVSERVNPFMKKMEDEEYLTPQQTAEMLGVTTNTLWRWNRDSYLKNVKVGRKLFYKKSDVLKLLDGVRPKTL